MLDLALMHNFGVAADHEDEDENEPRLSRFSAYFRY